MATYNKENASSWQKFLSPLVAALIAVCGAGAAYLKSGDNTAKSEDRMIERIVKMEAVQESQKASILKLERDSDLLKGTLGEMNASLSYIRGKLETVGGKR